LEYNLQLFDSSAINRFPDDLMLILKKVADNPAISFPELRSFFKTKKKPVSLKLQQKRIEYVSPKTPIEKTIAEIWQDLFAIKQIGINDNFFDLGGHSLLGVRLIAEIEKAIGKPVPLQAFFRFTTVEQMAKAIETEDTSLPIADTDKSTGPGLSEQNYKKMLAVIAGNEFPSVKPGALMMQMNINGARPPLFWCLNHPEREVPNLAKYLGKDQPVYIIYTGARVLKDDEDTLKSVAAHFVDEIVSVQPYGPYFIGGNCIGAKLAHILCRQLIQHGKQIALLCLAEFFDPQLYEYSDRMLLLFFKDTLERLQTENKFNWPEHGWDKPFKSIPNVEIIPGVHGEVLTVPGTAKVLAKHLLMSMNIDSSMLKHALEKFMKTNLKQQKQIENMTEEIKQLNQAAALKNQHIQAVEHSISFRTGWTLTYPLRLVRDILRNNRKKS
jgi:thioesterase domain-containing protein/acyl carrier protein